MPEITPTETPTTLADLAQSGSIREYRAVRAGTKSVKDVVAARPTPPAATIESTTGETPPAAAEAPPAEPETSPEAAAEAAKTLAARKTGLATRKSSIQAEIDALTRTKHETRRDADTARAELEALRAQLAALKAPPPGSPPAARDPEAEPTPDQFETYEEFVKAQARWEARQEVKAAFAAAQDHAHQTRQTQAEQDLMAAFEVRKTAAKAKHADFDEIVNAQADLPMSPSMKAVLVGSELGAELVYYLASHPEDATRIAALPPVRQIHELGKLEARLEAVHSGPAATVPAQSQAPAPIKPVSVDATASSPSLEQVAVAGDMKRYRTLRERRAS